MCYACCAAQTSRKLTFLYLANDVIQNSKKKGPEFTQDFAPVIVDAFKHVYRSGFILQIISKLVSVYISVNTFLSYPFLGLGKVFIYCLSFNTLISWHQLNFTKLFKAYVPVVSCVFLSRDGEDGCKKQLGRVLSIWQERAVYENNLLDQLSQVLCEFTKRWPAPAT